MSDTHIQSERERRGREKGNITNTFTGTAKKTYGRLRIVGVQKELDGTLQIPIKFPHCFLNPRKRKRQKLRYLYKS
jgi:hypothetical protein